MEPSEGEDNGIDAMFVASISRPLPREIEAFISKPIRLGILIDSIPSFSSCSWPTAAPFGIGLYSSETATKLVESITSSARLASKDPKAHSLTRCRSGYYTDQGNSGDDAHAPMMEHACG
jgi:hypothetical protein